MRTPEVGKKERAREFALKVTEYEPRKLAARTLDISPETYKAIKSHHAPGGRLIARWAKRFGRAFTDFVSGEQTDVRVAALQARIELWERELAEIKGNRG